MRIERIELRKILLPYVTMFETSGWRETGSHAIIVRMEADGIVAWGESPTGESPFYNEENQKTAWVITQDYLAPMLLQADLSSAWDVTPAFAHVRGNRMAKAGLEFTVWDLFARREGRSLASLLGGTRDRVEVGVSVGIQKDIPTLLRVVGGYLDEGYTRIKLKIKPGWDIEPTRAVRGRGPICACKSTPTASITCPTPRTWPSSTPSTCCWSSSRWRTTTSSTTPSSSPCCARRSAWTRASSRPEHARWAIEMNACDIINIKPSRIGGLGDAIEIHDMAQAAGMPVWHGGMLETGIGRAVNVALASLPNFTLPGDISANDRYFKRDIVKNPFTINADSTLTVPTGIGHGAIVDEDYLDEVTLERWEIGA